MVDVLPDTIGALIDAQGKRYGSKKAIIGIWEGHETVVSYQQFAERTKVIAGWLRRLGYARGDVLGLWLPNVPEWLMFEFAAARLGVVVLALNTRYRSHELGHLMQLSQAKGIVLMPEFLNIDFPGILQDVTTRQDTDYLRHVFLVGNQSRTYRFGSRDVVPYSDLIRPIEEVTNLALPSDTINVFGTSGTTSSPKLAAHDQKSTCIHAVRVADRFRIGEDDVTMHVLPFCGVHGFTAAMAAIAGGATLVSMPLFDARQTAESMNRHHVSFFPASHTMVRAIINLSDFDFTRLNDWKGGTFATLSNPMKLARDVEVKTGARITNVYGSSECFAMISAWPWESDAATRSRAGGTLVSNDIHVRVVDSDTGRILNCGEPGELQFKGYNVFTEYLSNPVGTSAAFTADGWFHSGDQGYMIDDRTFVFTSRLGDAIRLRGFLASPVDIEEYLMSYPGVKMAQVVGLRLHEDEDEIAVAFVQMSKGAMVSTHELKEYCWKGLASFKVPGRIYFIEEFPMTLSANSDKVRKVRLREMALELEQQGEGATDQ